jgi:hypothetical protein
LTHPLPHTYNLFCSAEVSVRVFSASWLPPALSPGW